MKGRTISAFWDRSNLLNINSNFSNLFELVNTLKDLSLDTINGEKLTEEQFKNLQLTLNGLVKKGDLTVSDIDFNSGKIGINLLSDEVIEAMTGETPVGAIPEDYSIPLEKLSFVNKSSNLFNKNVATPNKYVVQTDGTLANNSSYTVSDYIKIKPNTIYRKSSNLLYYAFYTSDKKYITTTTTSTTTLLTPNNAQYLRVTLNKSEVDSFMVVEGNTLPESYIPYSVNIPSKFVDIDLSEMNGSISANRLENKSITLNKLGFLKTSVNKFNKNTVTRDFYVNPTTGLLSPNTNWTSSNYIDVNNGEDYYKSTTNTYYAWYDVNKTYISTTTITNNVIKAPENASYLRVSVQPSELATYMVSEGNKAPTQYEEFYNFIPSELIDHKAEDKSVYGKHHLKTLVSDIAKTTNPRGDYRTEIAFIGDSWIQGGQYTSGDRLTIQLRDRMKEMLGDGGIGFVGLANNHVGNGYLSVALGGTWVEYDESKYNIEQSLGLDSAMIESTTPNSTIKVTFNEEVNYYEIHTAPNTGTWRYNIDGGAWFDVNSSQEITQINMALGKHTINIEHLTGKTTFIGSYAYKSNNGVVIHKIGNGGIKASHMASTNRDNYIKQISRCKANTYGILLGTNDMSQNSTPEQHKADLAEVVSRIREGNSKADIFLIMPSGNNLTGRQFKMSEYRDVQYQLATELELGFVSLLDILGDFETTNANGLMLGDGIHPNENGGYAISNVVYDRLLRL